MFVIVTYDVSQKRVTKVMKISRKYLNHIQNSVFEGMIMKSRIILEAGIARQFKRLTENII